MSHKIYPMTRSTLSLLEYRLVHTIALGSLLTLACLGCGKDRFPRDKSIVPVGGVVTIDGEPTSFVKVVFATPADVEKFKAKEHKILPGLSAKTNDKGEFAMTTTHAYDGLAPGDYIVSFEWQPDGVGDEFFLEGIPPANIMKLYPPKLAAIHKKYSAGKADTIAVKIEPGKPQKDLKFDLVSK